jgi:hypothetical protein
MVKVVLMDAYALASVGWRDRDCREALITRVAWCAPVRRAIRAVVMLGT